MARTTPVNEGYSIINGSVTGSNGSKIDTWVEWKVTSTSVANNTSNVRIILYAQATTSVSTNYDSTENYGWVGYDNGNKNWMSKSGYDFRNKALITFGDHTFTISHNSDGTKTLTIQGGWSTNGHSSYIKDGSVSGQVTLPRIARASTISSLSTNLGSAGTITITRQSSDFTHTLTYTFGSASGTIATKTTSTSVSWTPDVSLINQFGANDKTKTGTITCTTYSGNTSVGTSTSTLTLTIPNSYMDSVGGRYGQAITLTALNKCSSGLSYTFAYEYGGTWHTIGTSTTKTISWTLETSRIGGVDNASTGDIPIRVRTYRGTTLVNEATSMAWMTIPQNTSSAVSGDIGSALTIAISKAHSKLTSTITYQFGSTSGTIATTTTSTSVSWTPNTSLLTQIPNSSSGTGSITITTYNGTAPCGSMTYTLTLSAASSVVPTSTLSLARINTNSIVNGWHIYLQGYSQVEVTLQGTGVSGSTIKSMSISGTGLSSSSSPTTSSATLTGVSSVLQTSGTLTYTGNVSDSRNRSATRKTQSISVVPYSQPSVSGISLARSNSSGTIDTSGTYLKVAFTLNYSSADGHNSASVSLRYKESSASSWTTYGVVTNGANLNLNLDVSKNYQAQLLVSDALNSNIQSATINIPSAERVLNVNGSGSGLAIGGFSTDAGTFQEYYPAKFAEIVRAEIKKFDGNRPTSANVTENGKGGMSYFLATSSMTEGKPPISDGHIIHLGWDNLNGLDSQLAVVHTSQPQVYVRTQTSGVWGDWMAVGDAFMGNLTSGDFNDLTARGTYFINTNSGMTNAPYGDYGYLVVRHFNVGTTLERTVQIFTRLYGHGVYQRAYANGEWRPWYCLYAYGDYSTTAEGLTINVRRRGTFCRVSVSGTPTSTVATSGAYYNLATLPELYRPSLSPVDFAIFNATTCGQFNITNAGVIRLGYTRDFSGNNKSLSGPIYLTKSYECAD